VNKILQQISDIKNASTINKPWGFYDSLEFSQASSYLSSCSISILDAHTKLLVDSSSLEQAFGNFHKGD